MTLLRGGSAGRVSGVAMLLVLIGAFARCGIDAQGLGANATTGSIPDGGLEQGMGVLLDAAPGTKRDGSAPTADRPPGMIADSSSPQPADAASAEEDAGEMLPADGTPLPHALLVVGDDDPSDDYLTKRLEKLGFDVTLFAVRDMKGPPHVREIAPMHDVIVFSTTYNAATFGGALYDDLPVGIVNLEHSLYPFLQMVRGGDNNVGTVDDQTRLEVLLPAHPLAAGLPDGNNTVVANPSRFDWGRPLDTAIKVAVGSNDNNLGLIFAFDKGMNLANMKAPARRVGFFPNALAVPSLNSKGWALFDAAVRWAATP